MHLLTFPNSSTLISPSLSQSNKAKASFRQSMSLDVTCLSGLTLRAGGLAIRGRRSSAVRGGKPSTGFSVLLAAQLLLLVSCYELATQLPHPPHSQRRQAGYLSEIHPNQIEAMPKTGKQIWLRIFEIRPPLIFLNICRQKANLSKYS